MRARARGRSAGRHHPRQRIEKLVDATYWNVYYAMSVDAKEIEGATGYRPNVGNPGRLRLIDGKWTQIRPPVPCWSLWEMHVGMGDWDPEANDYSYHLAGCCFSGDGRFDMGRLNGPRAMTLKDAWNSAKFQGLRQAHLDDKVRGTLCEPCIYGAS